MRWSDAGEALKGDGVLIAALIWGAIVYARGRTIGERVGSIVADAD